jgi:hypothetical protein
LKLQSTYVYVEVTSGASYEANLAAAKDSNLPVGDRVTYGKFCDLYELKENNFFLIRC